jgi:rhamnosyltransferase
LVENVTVTNSNPDLKSIGVVIRTLNESELIGRCLETLGGQVGGFELDVVVVDSGSEDSTVGIARDYGARIVELEPAKFDYSTALNAGIEAVHGDFVVNLSAHAIPLDERWLEAMMAPFADPQVAGVAGRQVPWPGASWEEVRRLRLQFGSVRREYSSENADEMVFSNSASCIRRSVWLDAPFTLPAVEDMDWARRVIAAGWKIVYEPEAAVYHSHHEGVRAKARRLIDISRASDMRGADRTTRRTVHEAVGFVHRDATAVLSLDEPFRRKLRYLIDIFRVAWFYVIDSSRSGTTAERRREDF